MHDIIVKDQPCYKTHWICEKWSEEAVEFSRKYLDNLGISHVESSLLPNGRPSIIPITKGIPSGLLRLIAGEAEIVEEIEGNMLLNAGIARLQDLSMIATLLTNQTSTNTWSNANAQLGVGDSSAAEAATQTGLQAATNKLFKAMNATFPSRSGQTISFVSDFLTAEANFVWAEWCASQGAGTTLLNRKVAALGTKASGTWTLTSQVTLS